MSHLLVTTTETEDTVSEQTMQLINSNPSGSTAEH